MTQLTTYLRSVTAAREFLGRRNNGDESPDRLIAAAQVEATLAVAEQLRIANVFTYAEHVVSDIRRADSEAASIGLRSPVDAAEREKVEAIIERAARDLDPQGDGA